jgi:hypothetical protein
MKPIPVGMMDTIGDTWANPDYNAIENKYSKIKFWKINNTWVTNSRTSSDKALKKGTYCLMSTIFSLQRQLLFPFYSIWVYGGYRSKPI